MADRTTTSITIGGTIPAALLPDLLAAIEHEGAFASWDEERVEIGHFRDGPPLEICAYEVSGGILTEIEALCETNAIPFVRTSGSCAGTFGPERVVFRGEGATESFDVTESDEIVLTLHGLRTLGSIEAAEAWFASADFAPPPLAIVGELPSETSVADHG